MLAALPPIPFARAVTTTTARDAIPTGQRVEGMLVYVAGDQITYQLLPAPWTFTDSDWGVFSALNPYTIPVFTLFNFDAPTIVIGGTQISGSHTFNWGTDPDSNVGANSISITDVTTSTTLATALANDGTQTITLSSVTINTGDTHTWRITAADSKGNPFTRDFSVTGIAASDKVYYVRTDGSDSNTGLADNSGGGWLTPAHAALVVDTGDRVHLRTGTYSGWVLGWDAPVNGADQHPIWFDADSGFTINHRSPKTFDAVDVEACNYIKITGHTITNDGTVQRGGIRMSGGSFGSTISGNTVTGMGRFGIITGQLQQCSITANTVSGTLAGGGQNTGHGIYCANAGDTVSITDNVSHDNAGDDLHTNGDISQGGTGIQTRLTIARNQLFNSNLIQPGGAMNCDGLTQSFIENNLVYGAQSAGLALYKIDAAAPATGNVVRNNTILVAAASPKSCARLAFGAANNVFFNNILFNASASGAVYECDGDSIPESDYNLVSNRFIIDEEVMDLATWQARTGQDTHSILITSLAEVFTDPAGDDYSLRPDGPAVGAGIATFGGFSAPTDYLDGTARPGGTPDCGCSPIRDALLVVDHVPATGATDQAPAVTVTFTFDRDVDPDSIVFTLDGGSDVPGSLSYDSGSFTATFTPDADLDEHTTYTATVSAATGTDDVTLESPVAWSFTVGSLVTVNFFGSTVPPNVATGDSASYSLGMLFTASVGGKILGGRFYKAATNTGLHKATLYSVNPSNGAVTGTLATVDFTGETSSGWQEQLFAAAASITAGSLYKIAIDMPVGNYGYQAHYFDAPVTVGVLTAPADASGTDARLGQCTFASPPSYPNTAAANATNFWVDVIFEALP